MHITTAAPNASHEDLRLWGALRAYLNLPIPLAAILRRPYRFLQQGSDDRDRAAREGATVLQLSQPTKNDRKTTDDQDAT